VDDEELARSRLSIMLGEIEGMELCGSFGTAVEALQYIEEYLVNVVFLDISMPEMDGMEFANRLLEQGSSAKVVFVTGYEEYAVDAFELEAVDYLLKPISRERLAKTVRRLMIPKKSELQQLCVSCFGGFKVSVRDSGDVITWRSPKVEELFAFLICKGSVSRDEIADTLWDGFMLDKAMKNINSTVYYIRKALQQYGLESCVLTTHRQISIDTRKISCDLYEFEKLQQSGRSLENRVERLNELYRGELFQGKTYEWSFLKANAIEESLITNLIKRSEQWEKQEQYEKAEHLYWRVMELNPFHEETYGHLVTIYIKTGKHRKAELLRQQMEQLLAEDTALTPLKPLPWVMKKSP
jgi:two-component SAPR family response regulator